MLSFLVAAGLLAQPNIEAVVGCMKIDDDAARLACYDVQLGRAPPAAHAVQADGEPQSPGGAVAATAVVETGTAAPVVEPTPAAQASAIPARPDDDFGLTAEQRDARASRAEKTKRIDRITAIVQSAQMTASGRLLMTLDNGQQWVLVEPSQRQFFFEGEPITIRKASLGSFLASGPRSGTGIRIRRVE